MTVGKLGQEVAVGKLYIFIGENNMIQFRTLHLPTLFKCIKNLGSTSQLPKGSGHQKIRMITILPP